MNEMSESMDAIVEAIDIFGEGSCVQIAKLMCVCDAKANGEKVADPRLVLNGLSQDKV